MVVTEPPQAFLVVASLMAAVAAVALIRAAQLAQAAPAVAQMVQLEAQPEMRELLIPAAVVVELDMLPQPKVAARAALASSSSSTTSALPQSLPSSHRKSGLHQRVR